MQDLGFLALRALWRVERVYTASAAAAATTKILHDLIYKMSIIPKVWAMNLNPNSYGNLVGGACINT